MVARNTTAEIKLWDQRLGAVTWLHDKGYAVFRFADTFLNSGLDVSPIHLSIASALKSNPPISFPSLNFATFKGLPGLLADALPDKFGNQLIDAWLAQQGLATQDFNPVDRLCYLGKRSLGALEFYPVVNKQLEKSLTINLTELAEIAQMVMQERTSFADSFAGNEKDTAQALLNILSVSTSAGGARPKAIIALNDKGEVRSGQAPAPKDFDYWLLKFDGVNDVELGAPNGYGKIEYAYYLMAKAAGIEMTECRLLHENDRSHFLTKRFDRVDGEKIHMQSFCGLQHYDFNAPGAFSYEQAFATMRQLRLPASAAEQLFRRMVFNVLARNQDDHTKNISFLMGRDGVWRLAPAYDVTYAHNPAGQWTNQQQMRLNGKRDQFVLDDFLTIGQAINLKTSREIVEQISATVKAWPHYAALAGVDDQQRIDRIANAHRFIP